jgi:hypothetical protein
VAHEHTRRIPYKDEGKMSGGLKVQCYAGYKANQRPSAFSLGKKKMKVTEILDQWYGPDHTYFKVLGDDANTYILRYSKKDDRWELVFFKEGNYAGELWAGIGKDATS